MITPDIWTWTDGTAAPAVGEQADEWLFTTRRKILLRMTVVVLALFL
jgi:hypothetical protein